ncbi:Msc7p [Malassezia vespertilionis]|uniref:Msc7p n=1 Tax=Malassezia vespertilionis TaxID=2020962 RepID=A0A2N1JDN8_9BASI|nr:Msc7p [Malassezia vespertilionis]
MEASWLAVGGTLGAVAGAYLLWARRERSVPIAPLDAPPAAPGWKGTFRDANALLFENGTVHCYDPATGYILGAFPADTPSTISDKIGRAAEAQAVWRRSTWRERREVLRTMQAWLMHDMESVVRVACRDTGKTMIDAAFGELLTTCSKLAWTIQHGERVLRTETRSGNLLMAHKRSTVVHEPLGVVAACVSWNYPVHNMLGPVISALFAGNAIVIKASEHVAWSSHLVLDAVRRCLRACGHAPELVQLVVCTPDDAALLTRDPRLAHITFIGSDAVGRKVAAAAAPQLTATTLELGGKDPAVILEGTDIAFFSSMLMRSCFQAMGQNCIGIERFLVHSALESKLLDAILPRIAALRCGSALDETRFGTLSTCNEDAIDCGAMISDARFAHLEALVEEAVAQGATLHVGGRRIRHETWPLGHYFAPTLLSHVAPWMRIAQEEAFAPIFLVMRFDTREEAIALANGVPYGLGASVFGPRRAACMDVANALQCGMVNINDFGISYLNQGLPFGGCKDSGYGRFAGPEGLLGLTQPKAITEDLAFGIVQTSIPPVVDYPVRNTQKSWAFLRSLSV